MKIAIDARLYGPGGTGIGKYTESLIENLQKIDRDNKYFILLQKSNWYLFDVKSRNFGKVMADAPFYSLKEQTIIPAVLMKIKPDLVHFTHFNVPLLYSGKFVVTIHDTIKSEFASTSATTRALPIYFVKHVGYSFTIWTAVKRAKKIFVPSNFIKKKLVKTFGIHPDKIAVTYESADEVFLEAGKKNFPEGKIKEVLAKYGVHKPFILYVGNAFPYKNLGTLLEALKLSPKKIKLVYASGRNVFVDRLFIMARELGVDDRLVITGFVPNEELAILYKQTECLVFPSLSEGFGLPGIEAMAAGCPVVCSNIPVFKEVYGGAAAYFDPKDPKDIAEKIEFIIKNSEFRNSLIKKGFEQVKRYSWKKLAQETLEVYQKVLKAT